MPNAGLPKTHDETSKNVLVTMTVIGAPPSILLSQLGLTFNVIENGAMGPSQTFSILKWGPGDAELERFCSKLAVLADDSTRRRTIHRRFGEQTTGDGNSYCRQSVHRKLLRANLSRLKSR